MKKKVSFTSKGLRADIATYKIMRMIGNRQVAAVGPIVFLDYALPIKHAPGEPPRKANGEGAHPHRGIATLTYVLNGEAVHLDSKGHYAKVNSGGVQWMKAGNGIIHDEVLNVDPHTTDLLTQALQFWINLPSKNKAEPPKYLSLQADKIPQMQLEENSGWLKVIAGEYKNLSSSIPAYSKQFIFHIHLENGKSFSIDTDSDVEYAAFLPFGNAIINDKEYTKGELVLFDKEKGTIEVKSTSASPTDIIILGGEKYGEPIVAQGPFVMNTQNEISQAYNDFYQGKYGKVDYNLAS